MRSQRFFMAFKIYFGVPGTGKTTRCASIVAKNSRKGIPTYSNVPIQGAILIDSSDIGVCHIAGPADLIIDEASIDFNNRSFKSLPKHTIQWFKLYRHYHISNIHVFSQSYDDMDITLRRLADEYYLCKRSLIPKFFYTRRIRRRIGIDDQTHQIVDLFEFVPFSRRYLFAPRYWKLFDSYDAPQLPPKLFKQL